MNLPLSFRAVGLLGGTFDPVHEGHLAIARAVAAHFGLDQVRLIPAREPVHRPAPTADAQHRLAMLRLAVAPYPELAVDTREMDSPQQNYTLWTLQSLRAELPDTPLLWIIGEDAFAQLPGWRRWQELFDVAHFVVINRAGRYQMSDTRYQEGVIARNEVTKQSSSPSPPLPLPQAGEGEGEGRSPPLPSLSPYPSPAESGRGEAFPSSLPCGREVGKEGREGLGGDGVGKDQETEVRNQIGRQIAAPTALPLRLARRGSNLLPVTVQNAPSPPTPLPQGERGAVFSALPEILQAAVAFRLTENKRALTSRPAGLVYHLTVPPQPASSTKIRAALAAGGADDLTDLLPAPVLAYIARQALYQVTTHGS